MIDPIMLALAKKLGGGGSTETTVETDILAEQDFTTVYADTYGCYCFGLSVAFEFVIGETYLVEFDGETHTCVATDANSMMDGAVAIGNGTGWGLSGNNEPFCMYVCNGYFGAACLNDTESTTHTVRIYQKVTGSSQVPAVSSADNGKFMQVVDGKWTAVAIENAEEVEV